MILPLAAVLSNLLDFIVSLAALLVLLAVGHIVPGPRLLLLPVWLLLILMLASGIGLYLSALMVRYRDVQYVMPVILQCLLYASPVAYGISAVPARYRTLYSLNPLAGPLEGFRWSLLGVGELHAGALAYTAAVALAALIVGVLGFSRMQRRFADVI
jgi:lipopolysaccharide transport system permease protein